MQQSALERQYEELLQRVLRSPDPVLALRTEREKFPTNHPLATVLANIDADGLRVTSLLVARLRFERLIQGSDLASRWFDEDAEVFTQTFRKYHAETPMRAFFPREEAADFARWQRKQRRGPS